MRADNELHQEVERYKRREIIIEWVLYGAVLIATVFLGFFAITTYIADKGF